MQIQYKDIFKRYKYTSQRPQLPKYLGLLIQSLQSNFEKMVRKNKIKRYYAASLTLYVSLI